MTADAAALARFTTALEGATGRAAAFAALGELVAATLSPRLFTVMTLDWQAGLARRAFSNRPTAYPVSGDKPIERNAWFETIHDRGETFVANTIGEIARVFPDADTIAALGCASVMNLPIRLRGTTVGTLNLLDAEAAFDAATVARAEASLRLPAMAAWHVEDRWPPSG